MSLSFLAKATNCDSRNIQRELRRLDERNIIKQSIIKNNRFIGFNKNYHEWNNGETDNGETDNGETDNGETDNCQDRQSNIGETDKETIGETTNQERKKEKLKESIPLKKESKTFSEVYNITLTPEETNYISVLSRIKDYPLDEVKDIEYMRTLKERYPSLDMVQAINKFSDYILDKPFKENANHRSQINTSFNKYVEWGACLKKVNNQDSRLGVPPCESILGERETPWM